jgi:hypothetical protein
MKIVQQNKKLISDNGSYRVYAELTELDGELKTNSLKFKTVWMDAQDPTAEQTKFEMFLDQEQLKRLKELF